MAIVEEFEGRGWVSRDGQRLFETKYRGIVDREQTVTGPTFGGGRSILTGLDEIRGTLDLDEKHAWGLMQQPEGLRLHLKPTDGRTLRIVVTDISGSFHGNGWE
jgi:hypothetical protein